MFWLVNSLSFFHFYRPKEMITCHKLKWKLWILLDLTLKVWNIKGSRAISVSKDIRIKIYSLEWVISSLRYIQFFLCFFTVIENFLLYGFFNRFPKSVFYFDLYFYIYFSLILFGVKMNREGFLFPLWSYSFYLIIWNLDVLLV